MRINKKDRQRMLYVLLEVFCVALVFVGYLSKQCNIIVFAIIAGIILFYICLRIKKDRIIECLYNLIPGIGSLYLLTYPIMRFVLMVLPTPIKGVTDDSVIKSTMLGGVFLLGYCAMALINQPKINRKKNSVENNFYHEITITSNNIIIDVVFLLFFVLGIVLYRRIGGINAVVAGLVSRRDVSQTYSEVSVYNYIEYAFIAYTIYSYYAFKNKKIININKAVSTFRVIFIFLYWIMQLFVGNRRGIIYVVLGIILYHSSSNSKLKKLDLLKKPILIILSVLAIAGLMYISILRNVVTLSHEIRLRDIFGEFIYPMVTCYYYVGSGSQSFLFGYSFLMVLAILIPRSVWNTKPLSLANQFTLDYNTTMGYAYTPYTELYRNFGVVGPIIGLLVYNPLFLYVTRRREKYPIVYLILYIELVNFFRGEFATTFVEFIIMYLTFRIMYMINRKKKKRR